MLHPRVRFETHQTDLALAAHEEHDVAIGLLLLAEELLLDHLRVVDEANELPLAQVDDLLGHVKCHVHDADLFILRRVTFVGQQGVINDPGLPDRALRIV